MVHEYILKRRKTNIYRFHCNENVYCCNISKCYTTCSQTNDTLASGKHEKMEKDHLRRQFNWEDTHMGNFRRIYPCHDENKYQYFFMQNTLSVFQDTAASRARDEASRIQREENEVNFFFLTSHFLSTFIFRNKT